MPSKEAKKLFKGIMYNYPTYDAGGRVKTYYDDGGKLPVDEGAIETPEDDIKERDFIEDLTKDVDTSLMPHTDTLKAIKERHARFLKDRENNG